MPKPQKWSRVREWAGPVAVVVGIGLVTVACVLALAWYMGTKGDPALINL